MTVMSNVNDFCHMALFDYPTGECGHIPFSLLTSQFQFVVRTLESTILIWNSKTNIFQERILMPGLCLLWWWSLKCFLLSFHLRIFHKLEFTLCYCHCSIMHRKVTTSVQLFGLTNIAMWTKSLPFGAEVKRHACLWSKLTVFDWGKGNNFWFELSSRAQN